MVAMRLPPELEDMVISHFYGNRAALRSCSLVCKSWRHRAQSLLYHQVELGASPNRDESVLEKESFVCHITKYPHLCLYVRCLRVSGQIRADALATILRHSPNIEHLDFVRTSVHVRYPSRLPAALETFLAALLSLRELQTARLHLHFDGYDFAPVMTDTVLPVSGLRRLRSLDLAISEPYPPSDVKPVLRQAILQSRCSASEAAGCSISRFGLVLRCRNEEEHEDEDVRGIWNDEIQNNNLLLEGLGCGIEHLKITIELAHDFHGRIAQLQLAPCVRLRTLEIVAVWDCIDLADDGDDRHVALDSARAVLASLPPEAPLEGVALVIEHGDAFAEFFGPVGAARHLDALGALEGRLCSLPRLKSLTLQARGGEVFGDDRSMHVWAAQRLPRLAAKEGVVIKCDKAALPTNLWNER